MQSDSFSSDDDKKLRNEVQNMRDELIVFKKPKDIFSKKFVDPKYSIIKITIQKLNEQVNLLKKSSNKKLIDIHFNGISAASRALSELVCQILLLSNKFRKKLAEEIFSKKNKKINNLQKYNQKLFNLKSSNLSEKDFFINNAEFWILEAKFKNTSSIFHDTKKMFKNKNIDKNFLNDCINEIQKISPLEIWDWIFSEKRYRFESRAIHNPYYFNLKENLEENIKYFHKNLRIFNLIIENVFE